MHIFKKIGFIIIFSLFCTSTCAYAQIVQISDSGVYNLTKAMNQLAKNINSPYQVENLEHIPPLVNESPYDIYLATMGARNHGSVISFYCNKAGFVSKVVIMNALNDKEAIKASAYASTLLITVLGLSTNEQNVLCSSRLNTQGHSDVWCSKSNRRIVFEVLPDKSNKILTTRLTAYDS